MLKAELVLKDASKILNNLQLGNGILMYEELYNLFRSLSISIERNKILYINSICDLKESNLNVKIVEEISEVIEIVSYFINQRQNVALEKFIIEYQNRYQEQELPLAQVLDPINGIGYILSESNLYVEKLIAEYLLLEDNNKVEKDIKSNSCSDIDLYLIELYVKAVKNSSYQIEISLDDIKDKLILKNNLSKTISILVNFVNVDHTLNKYWIHFKDISSFAIRSLSRFSLFNSEISDICENLSNIESDVSNNSIRAEIIHVPNLKVANIMQRKIFYQNEISLITRNKDFKNTQINYNDLFISIQNNRIVLRSKKLNKKVLPSLSNAYNFNITEFPVFKFLCELQYQDVSEGWEFNWGILDKQIGFMPRVIYKNVIISRAMWRFNKKEFDHIFRGIVIDKVSNFNKFRKLHKIPQMVLIKTTEGELFLNLKSIQCIEILLNVAKKLKDLEILTLYENLMQYGFSNVSDSNGSYENEYLFSFINSNNNSVNNENYSEIKFDKYDKKRNYLARKFLPDSEWLFYCIFCNKFNSDKILLLFKSLYIKECKLFLNIDKWFYKV
ncbi:MAG: lantibiotic dehydratase [Saprospiraceae bacterium]|nr:lantibiotic dehydratase [Saprospiraceae bacterium]